MESHVETQLATLLNDILEIQGDLLALLSKKRQLLAESDKDGLAKIAPEEERLAGQLGECVARREHLLDEARNEGFNGDTLSSLARNVGGGRNSQLDGKARQARQQAKLLRTSNLTNWLVIQRTLLHLSQMIEIIATGGQKSPTYGDKETVQPEGRLVDQVG